MTAEAQYFQLIDFNQVEIISPMIYPPRPTLVVSGVAPFRGADVSLVPLVYIGRPPYWGIQVACKPGDGTGSENEPDGGSAAYSVQIDLAGVTGTHGVEVIGATRTAQLVVMSEEEPTPEGA